MYKYPHNNHGHHINTFFGYGFDTCSSSVSFFKNASVRVLMDSLLSCNKKKRQDSKRNSSHTNPRYRKTKQLHKKRQDGFTGQPGRLLRLILTHGFYFLACDTISKPCSFGNSIGWKWTSGWWRPVYNHKQRKLFSNLLDKSIWKCTITTLLISPTCIVERGTKSRDANESRRPCFLPSLASMMSSPF